MMKTMLSKFSENSSANGIASGKLLSRYVKKQSLFAMLFAVLGLWLLQVVFSYLSELERISTLYLCRCDAVYFVPFALFS